MSDILSDDESDPVALWAEIHRLRDAAQGPDGYETWRQAAVAERERRVKAEKTLAAPSAEPTLTVRRVDGQWCMTHGGRDQSFGSSGRIVFHEDGMVQVQSMEKVRLPVGTEKIPVMRYTILPEVPAPSAEPTAACVEAMRMAVEVLRRVDVAVYAPVDEAITALEAQIGRGR